MLELSSLALEIPAFKKSICVAFDMVSVHVWSSFMK